MELRSAKALGSCPRTRKTTWWSSIPDDILSLIARRITSADDYVRFSSVCRPWYLLATETYETSKQELNLVPLHMSVTNHSKRVTVQNPTSDAMFVLDLPEPTGHTSWGSPFGWLITFDRNNHRFGLLNPFTGATIPLPRLPWVSSRDNLQAFLTANPDSNPCTCLVIIATKYDLAFTRPNRTRPNRHNKIWSPIRGAFRTIDLITSYKGNLYGLEVSPSWQPWQVRVLLFQMKRTKPKHRLVPRVVKFLTLDLTPYDKYGDKDYRSEKYLVDVNGYLCVCVRCYHWYSRSTVHFNLFKIDVLTGNLTQIMSLDDHCLFLSRNYSFSYKVACPPANLFEQPRYGLDEFVSNYVFYGDNPKNPYAFDAGVSDMLDSIKVCNMKDSPNSLCVPLWISPWIKFLELEDDSNVKSKVKS